MTKSTNNSDKHPSGSKLANHEEELASTDERLRAEAEKHSHALKDMEARCFFLNPLLPGYEC